MRARHPDLVICDVLMPTMDGYEFVRQLRADPGIAQTNVIFYTAHYHEREAQKLARNCGVSHVLTKPTEPQVILRVVEAALGELPSPAEAPAVEDFDREHLRLLTDKLSDNVEELARTNERLAALIDLSLQLASQRDPVQLLDQVCRGARDLIGSRYSALAVRAKETSHSLHFLTAGLSAERAAELAGVELDESVLGT